MKTLSFIFSLLITIDCFAAYVQPTVKGQDQTSKKTFKNLQVPNSQATVLASGTTLVETGNKNILVNPSFESNAYTTGWVPTGTISPGVDVSSYIDGKQSIFYLMSSKTMSLVQDSTSYASAFADGVQGLATIRIKTDVPGVKFCTRSAGVTSTSNCLTASTNNKWGLYKLPVILGNVSNGISVEVASSASGSLSIDDAYLGAQDLITDVSHCNSIDCETEFSAEISATGVVSKENYDWLNGNCSKSGSGNQRTTCFISGFTAPPNCTCSVATDGSNDAACVYSASNTSASIQFGTSVGAVNSGQIISVMCQKQGADFLNAKAKSNGNVYVSTQNEIVTTTRTVTAQSVASGLAEAKLIYASGFNVVDTDSLYDAANARWIIKNSGYYDITVGVSVGSAAAGRNFGNFIKVNGVGSPTNVSTITGSSGGNTNGATMPYIGVWLNRGDIIEHFVYWRDTAGTTAGYFTAAQLTLKATSASRPIVGQFANIEKCKDTYECTDVFSASIDNLAGHTLENLDWIDSCSVSGGTFTCNLKASVFTGTPTCTASIYGSSADRGVVMGSLSPTQFTATTILAGSPTAAGFKIICQKSGADYVGKTAKAVASDQNIRTPGLLKSVLYSAQIYIDSAGNCSTTMSKGNFIAGYTVVNATSCKINYISNTFANTPVCTISHTTPEGGIKTGRLYSNSSTDIVLNVSISPSSWAFSCHGESF